MTKVALCAALLGCSAQAASRCPQVYKEGSDQEVLESLWGSWSSDLRQRSWNEIDIAVARERCRRMKERGMLDDQHFGAICETFRGELLESRLWLLVQRWYDDSSLNVDHDPEATIGLKTEAVGFCHLVRCEYNDEYVPLLVNVETGEVSEARDAELCWELPD